MHRRVATSEGCTFFRKGTKCAGQALTIPTDMPHVLLAALAIGNECQRMHRPRRLFPNAVSLAAYAYPMYEKKSRSRGISRNLGRTKYPKSVNPRVRCIFLLKKKKKKIIAFSLVSLLRYYALYNNSKQHSFILLFRFTRHAHQPKRHHKSNTATTCSCTNSGILYYTKSKIRTAANRVSLITGCPLNNR